jgi:hypothetical protein
MLKMATSAFTLHPAIILVAAEPIIQSLDNVLNAHQASPSLTASAKTEK